MAESRSVPVYPYDHSNTYNLVDWGSLVYWTKIGDISKVSKIISETKATWNIQAYDESARLACVYGFLDIFIELVNNNLIDPETYNSLVRTALEFGRINIIKYIFERLNYQLRPVDLIETSSYFCNDDGAMMSVTGDNKTLLYISSYYGYSNIVKYLLSRGCNPFGLRSCQSDIIYHMLKRVCDGARMQKIIECTYVPYTTDGMENILYSELTDQWLYDSRIWRRVGCYM